MPLKTNKYLFLLIGVIELLRIIPMVFIPFTDPTEARYGEIARIMAQTGDWITPYYEINVPFWGKPPLAFWAQAFAFKLFGVHEFAPRLPAWLITLATLGLIYAVLKTQAGQRAALVGALLFSSSLLVFALSGGVLTDPYLAFAITLTLVSFVMVQKHNVSIWRYGFFVGLALGLLAKGPIAVIMACGPIALWLLLNRQRWQTLTLLPWISGTLLTAALTLPWYIAAEIKTPGFLEYFILGEHYQRFVNPGWKGDLYGAAHQYAKGTIWIQWLLASLPWGLLGLGILVKHLLGRQSRVRLWHKLAEDDISLYVLWAIFPMCFFTLSGNVLWTYPLPALPALAILLARYFSRVRQAGEKVLLSALTLGALLAPAMLLVMTYKTVQDPNYVETEKYLIARYQAVATKEDSLIFVNTRSFSARFYSREQIQVLPAAQVTELLITNNKTIYLGVHNDYLAEFRGQLTRPVQELYRSVNYTLLKLPAGPDPG